MFGNPKWLQEIDQLGACDLLPKASHRWPLNRRTRVANLLAVVAVIITTAAADLMYSAPWWLAGPQSAAVAMLCVSAWYHRYL